MKKRLLPLVCIVLFCFAAFGPLGAQAASLLPDADAGLTLYYQQDGKGHSLYEDMILDKDGRCVNANMTDYGVPMISEQPDDFKAVLIDVDDPDGPFGAKSISEIACNGAAPAIGNAIHDACGVWVRSWPMTPEKILRELGKIQ